MHRFISIGICLLFAILLCGCASKDIRLTQEKRQAVLNMREEVLDELYTISPEAKAEISKAPGYAVFSNANVNIIFVGFGGGYGVFKDNKSGKDTFLKMGQAGLGIGVGVKDFRAVFVFKNRSTIERFLRDGWEFSSSADAAAKLGNNGSDRGGAAEIDGIEVYQITKIGLALQASVYGTKYWKDNELN